MRFWIGHVPHQRARNDPPKGLKNFSDFIVIQIFMYVRDVHAIVPRSLLRELRDEMLGLK